MIIRKLSDKKLNILLIQGSPREIDTCPNMNSKTSKIIHYILEKYSPFANFLVVDLSVNQQKKSIIQPCKGCFSSAGGYHCHWECDCYKKGDKKAPDLMMDQDVYKKLEWCDVFIVFSPIHWYAPSSQIKSLFDRLVCANLTITQGEAVELMGKNSKNSKITGNLLKSGEYDHLLKNHLEGKIGSFFLHGDDGSNELESTNMERDNEEKNYAKKIKSFIMPIVMQCRYSGIEVPDELIEAFYTNVDKDYYTANLNFNENDDFLKKSESLMERILKLKN